MAAKGCETVKRMKTVVDQVIRGVSSVLVILLVTGALWQVFSRYVLNDPSIVTEELLRFGLIWTTMLGASYAFGTNQHLALTFIRNKLKGKPAQTVRMVNDLGILCFAAVIMVKGGIEIVSQTMAQLSPMLQWPMGIVYSILPISGALIIYYQLLNIAEWFKIKKDA